MAQRQLPLTSHLRSAPTSAALLAAIVVAFFTMTGSLESRSSQIGLGASMDEVRGIMGMPDDRQFSGNRELWQFCKTGAGFGWHDYRMVWFADGRVTGVTSYKASLPAVTCSHALQTARW